MPTVREEVAVNLAAKSERVRSIVINDLVEEKITEHVAAVRKGMQMLDDANLELRKIKPESPGFDGEGNPIQGIYTKEQFSKLNALKVKIKDLEDALNEAVGHREPNEAKQYSFSRIMSLTKKD